jgi:hypothetical protein
MAQTKANDVTCRVCGGTFDPYYISAGLCDGCKWDTYIPKGYMAREKYEHDPAWGHTNRTVRASLGVGFLDKHLLTCLEVMAMCKNKPQK